MGLRLVCFPFAGGGLSTFRAWGDALPDVEVHAVCLPGRDLRARERRFRSARLAAGAIANAIRSEVEEPYAFFGHSMGALLAFETARSLRDQGAALPVHLIVAARHAPDLPIPTSFYLQSDAELTRLVASYGRTPQRLLDSPVFQHTFLPLIRDDFEMAENYQHLAPDPLPMPITALAATRDPIAPKASMEGWSAFTAGAFRLRWFEGEHFFIQERELDVLAFVREILSVHVGPHK